MGQQYHAPLLVVVLLVQAAVLAQSVVPTSCADGGVLKYPAETCPTRTIDVSGESVNQGIAGLDAEQ